MEADVKDRRELTFPVAMDRLLVWLIAALVSWLCVSTLSLREQMAVLLERDLGTKAEMVAMKRELEKLGDAHKTQAEHLRQLQLLAAQHGWKEAQ